MDDILINTKEKVLYIKGEPTVFDMKEIIMLSIVGDDWTIKVSETPIYKETPQYPEEVEPENEQLKNDGSN